MEHTWKKLQAQTERLHVVDEALDAGRHIVVGRAVAVEAALGVEAHDLLEPGADAHHVGGQFEQLAELAVPAQEPQILVEHGDALARVIKRVLEQIVLEEEDEEEEDHQGGDDNSDSESDSGSE